MIEHLYELVTERAARYPKAVALGSQDGSGWRSLDSRQLLAAVDALAAELAARGVSAGDRVCTWLPGSWRTPVYFFAVWKLGAIVVPFDREVNAESAERIILSVEPRLVITGYAERPAWSPAEKTVEWWEPGAEGGARLPAPWTIPDEELAALFFTSGTTGNPKGCMITHANFCSQLEAVKECIPIDVSCRAASILPLSHLFEFTGGLLYPLHMGAAIHYVPSRRGPDILRVLQEQRITHMNAVPQLLSIMGKTIDEQLRSKLPSYVYRIMNGLAERLPMPGRRLLFRSVHKKLGGHLVLMTSGGAPLPDEVKRLWQRLGIRIVEGYGTSECSPAVTLSAPDGSTPAGHVGKPLRGVSVRLSPEGELLVKGPNVMRGYWRDPERTAEVLQDGWYATGDLAEIDPDGNIRLLGRAKELIALPSGMKVWPQDVEDTLRADSVVKDATVIPVPTSGGGMVLHAYLLAAPGVYRGTVDLGSLLSRCNARLAQHQRLASASWWPEADFPRTITLKVRRHLLPLPEKVADLDESQTLAPDDPLGMAIATVAGVQAVGRGQTLAELGLDSLAVVDLCLAIEERAGKMVTEQELRAEMTVEEVRALVEAAPPMPVVEKAPGVAGVPRAIIARGRGKAARFVGDWPYTWGRAFRWLALPFDLLYRYSVTRTIVLGRENLAHLPDDVIFAPVHHSFADLPLLRHGLATTPAKRFANRLMVAAAADGFASAGIFAKFAILAFGVYPLERGGAGDASLQQLARIAQKGNAVLLFPQGMHARPAQEKASDPSVRFRAGVARLAELMDTVVVPCGLAGTEKLMPPYLEEFRGLVLGGIPVSLSRGPLAIAFGAPVSREAEETETEFAARLQEVAFALTRQAEQALEQATGSPQVARS